MSYKELPLVHADELREVLETFAHLASPAHEELAVLLLVLLRGVALHGVVRAALGGDEAVEEHAVALDLKKKEETGVSLPVTALPGKNQLRSKREK